MVLERDDFGREVEVLPAPPLPDDLAARRHLEQVVRVDRPADFGSRQPAPDARVEIGGKGTQAEEDHIAVAELAGVMMVVRMLDLPDGLAVPVHLEGGARLEARPGFEAPEVVHDLAGIEEMTVVEQIAIESRTIGHPPGVDDLTAHIDEIYGSVAEHRGEQRVAPERARGIVSDEAGAGAADTLLIDRGHGVSSRPWAGCA